MRRIALYLLLGGLLIIRASARITSRLEPSWTISGSAKLNQFAALAAGWSRRRPSRNAGSGMSYDFNQVFNEDSPTDLGTVERSNLRLLHGFWPQSGFGHSNFHPFLTSKAGSEFPI